MFNKIFAELARNGGKAERIMIDATHLKAHSHRRQPFKKGPVPRRIGRTKGGLNSKLHAVCDGKGRPLVMLLSEGQMSDFKGAALMLPAMPGAKQLLADKGYDADWFREALANRKIAACIKTNAKPRSPTTPSTNNATESRTCSAGSRTGDASTPYDRCAHAYFSAICIAAAVIFWL